MLKTITTSDMRRVEARAAEAGLHGARLMERAAAQVARHASAMLAGRGGYTLCLCGAGNNGGDGLAAMRILAAGDEAFEGECLLLPGDMSADARAQLERLASEQPRITIKRVAEGAPPLPKAALIIDAMYGTGLSRPLCGAAAELCARVQEARRAGALVLSVDIPSGVSGDTGEALGAAIEADATVTFHRPKAGLYLRDGLDHTGELTVASIGIDETLDDADGLFVLERDDLAALLPARKRLSHKGSYGRVVLWVGSRGMAGAAAISALAALRTGAGLVTVACPDEILNTVQSLCPCATCAPLNMQSADEAFGTLMRALENADAFGAGCGLGRSEAVADVLCRVLRGLGESDMPIVLDADALNIIAAMNADERPALPCNTVITPHPAEAARLLGCATDEVTRDAAASARVLGEKYGAGVILKGAASVLYAREGMAISPFGTPAMAKGGSGDALTGALAALLAGRACGAYPMNGLEALQAACALHGLAGEAAARRYGERGALATDLVSRLGKVGAKPRRRNKNANIGETRADTDEPRKPLGGSSPLGSTVTVTVDRKLGEPHPNRPELIYLLNYGYVQEVYAADNDWQDAYIYGEGKPLEFFEGEVVAVIHRLNDAEDKWVVAQKGTRLTPEEVRRATDFQEQFFDIQIECL